MFYLSGIFNVFKVSGAYGNPDCTTHQCKGCSNGIDNIIATYNAAVTDTASEILGKNEILGKERRGKRDGPPKMLSTFVMREEI